MNDNSFGHDDGDIVQCFEGVYVYAADDDAWYFAGQESWSCHNDVREAVRWGTARLLGNVNR